MKKVALLMSTYNGEKYIDEQIHSIILQSDVELDIWIRDDGSCDNTICKIEEWKKGFPEKIHIYKGENIGYRKSFLQLLGIVPDEYEYYGFADQDDIWHPQKCINAIKKLENASNSTKLYVSNLNIVSENLTRLYKTNISDNYNITLYGYWIRARFAGCTYLFTRQLKQMAARYIDIGLDEKGMVDHDFLIGTLAFLYGTVIFDNNAFIEHRRVATSVTSGGRGILNRIRTELCYIFMRKDSHYLFARELLRYKTEDIDPKGVEFLEMIAKYKKSYMDKIDLISNREFRSGNRSFDVIFKVKVMLSNY